VRISENSYSTTFVNKGEKRKGRGGYEPRPDRSHRVLWCLNLHLEVLVLAVLSDHRPDQFFYRLYRLALSDAYYPRVVGIGRVDGQGETLRQARLYGSILCRLETFEVRDVVNNADVHVPPPFFLTCPEPTDQ
jgi:hypothetical protein